MFRLSRLELAMQAALEQQPNPGRYQFRPIYRYNMGKNWLKDTRRFDPTYHRAGTYGAKRLARGART